MNTSSGHCSASRLFALLSVCWAVAAAPQAAPVLLPVDPLVKVLRADTNLPLAAPTTHVAVGEYATLQFVFRTDAEVADLRASVTGLPPGAQVRWVGYVKVGSSYTTAASDLIASPDRLYPDPLLEDGSVRVPANQNQPVWITVRAREPGTMSGTLTLRWGGGEMRQPFSIHVHKVRLNKPRLWITNWWWDQPERLAWLAGHPVERFSPEYWRLLRHIADFMAVYHQNVALISPLDLARITRQGDRWQFDFSRFDRMVRLFISAGVIGRIEGAHVGHRAGDWPSPFVMRVPDGRGAFTNQPPSSPEARAFYLQFFRALDRHLRVWGWDRIYLQHLADEPIDENAGSYRQMADLLRQAAPQMRIVEATQTPKLVGAVDVWVPILHHLHRDADFFRQRQRAGDEVWFYTCCGPTGEYANRFIELPLIKTRLLHWINFRSGTTGYLHWGFNYWHPSVSPFEETRFRWPGGDQWIVYPKGGRLLSSIRLEAMRDGIADHELLSMLAERRPALAEKLAAEAVPELNRYDTDVQRFRTRRQLLLEALEATPIANPAER